jgi:hypothetical protein
VPEAQYDAFLTEASDPDGNYWDVVLDLPRTKPVHMQAVDNAYSLYEMVEGSVGTCHVGLIFHPVLPGTGDGSRQVFGTEGNLLFGAGYTASIISTRTDLLPHVDDDGWYTSLCAAISARPNGPSPRPAASTITMSRLSIWSTASWKTGSRSRTWIGGCTSPK